MLSTHSFYSLDEFVSVKMIHNTVCVCVWARACESDEQSM
jgi:hypothetical protein